MSNNQKSRFMEALDYFKQAELPEASALLMQAHAVVADRKELEQKEQPEPIRRRGRRPGSKNKPKGEEQAAE